MMEITSQEINRHFVAMGHSVTLINDVIAGKMQIENPREVIANNQAHLETMVAKDIWDGYDLAAIEEVIAIDSETVELVHYKDVSLPLSDLIGQEVQRRIFSHASANTQMNMTAAQSAGLLSDEQSEAYKQGLIWVRQMRAKGAELIDNEIDDYYSDSHWPEPSAAAVALAQAF